MNPDRRSTKGRKGNSAAENMVQSIRAGRLARERAKNPTAREGNKESTMEQTATPNPVEPATPTDGKPPAPPAKEKKAKPTSKTVKVTAKTAKPPREQKAERKDLRTLAIRIPEADLNRVHKTAGPRNMTQFVTAIVLAGAAEDEGQFRAALKAAKEARTAK